MPPRKALRLLLVFLIPLAIHSQDLKRQFWDAARRGDAKAVRELLARGVPVDTRVRGEATALVYACFAGHVEVVRVLLEHGANVNVKDDLYQGSALARAAWTGFLQAATEIAECGTFSTLNRAVPFADVNGAFAQE